MRVGAVKLKKYLNGKGINDSTFAKMIGKFPSTICRILKGDNCPDIQTALLIEEKTGGKVKVGDWIVEQPVPKAKQNESFITSGAINRK